MTESDFENLWLSLSIQNNFIFGKTFESNPDLCRRLLQLILNFHIKHISFLEREKVIEARTDSKGIRLDVYVEDKDTNRSFDVEMQVSDSDNLAKRMRYYQGLIDLDKLKHGQHYSALGDSFIIFICPFDHFNTGRHIYTFKENCAECPIIGLNDGATKIFLSTKGTADDVSPNLRAFLDYVDSGIIFGDFVQELDAAVQLVKSNRKAMKEFMTYEMSLLESRMEGEQQGLLRGLAEGEAIGFTKGTEDVARNMIKLGLDFSVIQSVTHLSIERIKELAANIFS